MPLACSIGAGGSTNRRVSFSSTSSMKGAASVVPSEFDDMHVWPSGQILPCTVHVGVSAHLSHAKLIGALEARGCHLKTCLQPLTTPSRDPNQTVPSQQTCTLPVCGASFCELSGRTLVEATVSHGVAQDARKDALATSWPPCVSRYRPEAEHIP